MLRSHRHCKGEFFASERPVDRSERGGYSASMWKMSFEFVSDRIHFFDAKTEAVIE
jgi:hypothetical protein